MILTIVEGGFFLLIKVCSGFRVLVIEVGILVGEVIEGILRF